MTFSVETNIAPFKEEDNVLSDDSDDEGHLVIDEGYISMENLAELKDDTCDVPTNMSCQQDSHNLGVKEPTNSKPKEEPSETLPMRK